MRRFCRIVCCDAIRARTGLCPAVIGCRVSRRRVRLHRDVLQPVEQARQKRDAVARKVRTAADFESGKRLEN